MCGVLNHVSPSPARAIPARGFVVMEKKPLSFRDQALLIQERGMGSRCLSREELTDEIEHRLQYINYYRLSAYWYPFRIQKNNGQPNRRSDRLLPGTC